MPGTGWVPNRPDYRDKLLCRDRRAAEKAAEKPTAKGRMLEVESRGQLGSCTANALAGNLEFLEKKAGKKATI